MFDKSVRPLEQARKWLVPMGRIDGRFSYGKNIC